MDPLFPLLRRRLGRAALHRLFPRRHGLLSLSRSNSPLVSTVDGDVSTAGRRHSLFAEPSHSSHLRHLRSFLFRLLTKSTASEIRAPRGFFLWNVPLCLSRSATARPLSPLPAKPHLPHAHRHRR